jgi:hypothetical protein
LPSIEPLMAMDGAKLLLQPLAILGVIDLALAVLIGLGMVNLYPVVRFRAALGLGLMGFMFYTQGLSLPLLQVTVGCIGLYLCTLLVSLIPAIIAAAAAVLGMGTLTWYLLSH